MKELKKVKGKRSGDAGPGYTSAWRLFRIMDFLRDSVKQAVSSVWWLFVYVHELVSLLSEPAAI